MGVSTSSLKPQNIVCSLPEELILSEILPKLPAKSLFRFKCVSKKWRHVITSDARLREAHTRHHIARKSFSGDETSEALVLAKHSNRERHKMLLISGHDNNNDPKVNKLDISYMIGNETRFPFEMHVIGSSNGLVLLSKSFFISHKNLILWNPATKEFRLIPNANEFGDENSVHNKSYYPTFDLGFDDVNNDHKAVTVGETILRKDDNIVVKSLEFQVYSKKSNWWTDIGRISGFQLWNRGLGVSTNGAFYILARKVTSHASYGNVVIMSFTYRNNDVKTLIRVPDCYYSAGQEIPLVDEFDLIRWKDSSLALFAQNPTPGNYAFDFWVLISDHNSVNGFSWSKIFEFSYRYPICGFLRDRFMIIQRHQRQHGIELSMWDPRINGERGFKRLVKLKRLWYFSVALHYVPSLVSPFNH